MAADARAELLVGGQAVRNQGYPWSTREKADVAVRSEPPDEELALTEAAKPTGPKRPQQLG